MRIEILSSISEIDAADWDSVVTDGGAPVFYQHAYISAYEQAPLTNADGFVYLVLRDGDRPIAVIPAYLQSAANPLRRLHEVYPEALGQPALLSHTWHCYDAHVPGKTEVLPTLLDAMTQVASAIGARWCGFVNVQRGNALSQALRAAGLPARHLTDRWVTDLTTYEHYLSGLGLRARANLRRNERRSRDAGVTVEVLPVDHASLDEITPLCVKTASRFENNGYYPGSTFTRFVRALGDLAHVIEVRQRGKLVAAGICLTDATRFHTWTCGVDYAVDGSYSPYGVLFAESVKHAISLGRTTLEGGRGNAVFKKRHGLRPHPLDAVLFQV
ncbi:GNAT family N-acetyltransferase [Lentzea sp. BCCO 10_0856]|uniref:GNAT family N-acetyltransferase n=1 Tax=Lentzea miocenica TaxID=3095431 RepID=A0ABU4SS22_9PSEU|nr:GNAT family N-acetyltransferase [Lentzea sp. BCCO 10_0856]MDX8028712.1 GNAT family N-acetyltransferase [Lentzea sp. BCCO 10_0856]